MPTWFTPFMPDSLLLWANPTETARPDRSPARYTIDVRISTSECSRAVRPGLPLSIECREQRLPRRRQVLIGGVHHRARDEVVAHQLHDLDRVLPAELLNLLRPELAA